MMTTAQACCLPLSPYVQHDYTPRVPTFPGLLQTAVLEKARATLHTPALSIDFSLSEHSLETWALICYRCAEF
jgi:hypothetical protein